FGWPRAREDQAECAVRAGLALIRTVSGLSAQDNLQLHVRVGISTGPVVVGDVIGETISLRGAAVGRTLNVAARLQAAAGPDTVLIDEPTRAELGRIFGLEPTPPLSLKGLSQPVSAWRVVEPLPVRTRFDARESRRGIFVGRAAELELLVERWRRAQTGQGQLVLLSGEAGIGKSRLVAALSDAIQAEPHLRLRYQCSPLHSDTPLYPVIQRYERALRVSESETDEARARRFEREFGRILKDDPLSLALIAELLALPLKGRPPLPDEPPAHRRQRLLLALERVLVRLSDRLPLLVIVEDVQWIDPSTKELVLRCMGLVENRRVLGIVTQRQPYSGEWTEAAGASRITLPRLSPNESLSLVMANAGEGLDHALAARIVEKADGVPLFLEEVTRAVAHDRATAPTRAFATGTDQFIPPTLNASLASRLDSLGPAKSLAQIGAVIGRRFPLALLAAVADRGTETLVHETEALVRSELLFAAQGPEVALVFKHALVHEAAYESLLQSDRRRLHQKVLQCLEEGSSSQVNAHAETLALHAERAGDWSRAAHYLSAACLKAVHRFANREAISLYERAARALARLPADQAALPAIDLRLRAFGAFHAVGDLDRMTEIIHETVEIAERIGDRRRIAAATCQLGFAYWISGQHAKALDRTRTALSIARSLDDFTLILSAQFNLANVHHALGEVREAATLHREIIRMLPGELATKRFGWIASPNLLSRAFVGWFLIELGEFDEALHILRGGERALEGIDQPFARVLIQMGLGLYHLRVGDFDAAVPILQEALGVSRAAEVLTLYPINAAWLGLALLGAERTSEAVAVLGDAVERETYRGGGRYTWIHLRLALAEAKFRAGQRAAAYEELEHATGLARTCREVVHHAYAKKLEGDFRLSDDDMAGARAAYELALATAEPRGLRPLAAHAKACLARCAARQGDDAEARRWATLARAEFHQLGLAYWARRVEPGAE
ncbi:MAG: AAA family ATPase, partial [Acetobacteraceae bacterium]|nr:AAA family ATPase [Acetobacteraceae bacterium]